MALKLTRFDAADFLETDENIEYYLTAIAEDNDPVLMASAMRKAVEAGREAFRAGRVPRKTYQAAPSSPTTGLLTPITPATKS